MTEQPLCNCEQYISITQIECDCYSQLKMALVITMILGKIPNKTPTGPSRTLLFIYKYNFNTILTIEDLSICNNADDVL